MCIYISNVLLNCKISVVWLFKEKQSMESNQSNVAKIITVNSPPPCHCACLAREDSWLSSEIPRFPIWVKQHLFCSDHPGTNPTLEHQITTSMADNTHDNRSRPICVHFEKTMSWDITEMNRTKVEYEWNGWIMPGLPRWPARGMQRDPKGYEFHCASNAEA